MMPGTLREVRAVGGSIHAGGSVTTVTISLGLDASGQTIQAFSFVTEFTMKWEVYC